MLYKSTSRPHVTQTSFKTFTRRMRHVAAFVLFFCFHSSLYSAVDIPTCESALGVTQTDCRALVALYHSTDGDNWINNDNWGTTTAPWYGVTVFTGNVSKVELHGNNLQGILPAEIGDFSGITVLYLFDNNIRGRIPPTLGRLANLRDFGLERNQLSGPIPAELGSATKLQILTLDENQLSGYLPETMGQLVDLFNLSFSHNNLEGTLPLSFENLNLEYFYINHNHLDAHPDGVAIIPPALTSWYGHIQFKNSDNQTIGPNSAMIPMLNFWSILILIGLITITSRYQRG